MCVLEAFPGLTSDSYAFYSHLITKTTKFSMK